MVSIKKIEYIINKIIKKKKKEKHLHAEFGMQIRKTLHQITDDKKEYKILQHAIFDFYQKYNSEQQKEYLEVRTYDGQIYNEKGKADNVKWTKEMQRIGENKGYLYSIHNHPLSTSVQSIADSDKIIRLNTKYAITLSTDGLMIIKNNNENKKLNPIDETDKNTQAWLGAYSLIHKFVNDEEKKCEKKYSNEFKDINERANKGLISDDDGNKEWNAIFRKYSKENIHAYVENYKNILNSEDLNLEIYHILKNPKRR